MTAGKRTQVSHLVSCLAFQGMYKSKSDLLLPTAAVSSPPPATAEQNPCIFHVSFSGASHADQDSTGSEDYILRGHNLNKCKILNKIWFNKSTWFFKQNFYIVRLEERIPGSHFKYRLCTEHVWCKEYFKTSTNDICTLFELLYIAKVMQRGPHDNKGQAS